jgi:hypothetical protein
MYMSSNEADKIDLAKDSSSVTPPRTRIVWRLLMAIVLVSACSCSGDNRGRKETYPVTGEVHVDGQPAAGIAVTLHDVKGIDSENPTTSSTTTDDDGKFSASTYEEGDGAPAGEYVLTFRWGKLNRMSMQFEGDELKGKYSDPTKSEFRVTVEEGKRADIGRIELSKK